MRHSPINQNAYTEVTDDWREVIRDSRVKPIHSEPIRLLQIKNEEPYISFKNTLFGHFTSTSITEPLTVQGTSYTGERKNEKKNKKRTQENSLAQNNSRQSVPNKNLYSAHIPIKTVKYQDLQFLKTFLEKPASRQFYENLTNVEVAKKAPSTRNTAGHDEEEEET
ncbi:hypothetical protein JTB14_023466 [Gonioctena quinquepunctata]|nr:hypothetical protein JTB14_023466 [Gonioctena quinquepunctata]